MITVTEVAKKKFRETIEAEDRQGHGLRVIVNNAGTDQPEFALNFVGPDDPVAAPRIERGPLPGRWNLDRQRPALEDRRLL